jgi:hypothetical protein
MEKIDNLHVCQDCHDLLILYSFSLKMDNIDSINRFMFNIHCFLSDILKDTSCQNVKRLRLNVKAFLLLLQQSDENDLVIMEAEGFDMNLFLQIMDKFIE